MSEKKRKPVKAQLERLFAERDSWGCIHTGCTNPVCQGQYDQADQAIDEFLKGLES